MRHCDRRRVAVPCLWLAALRDTRMTVIPAVIFLFLQVSGCGSGGNAGNGSSSPTTTFTIGGTVSGLTGTVVLQDNGGNNLSVSANGNFAFTTAVTSGSTYTVTVLTQPTGQSCTVTNGSGTASANVTNVGVTCVAVFTIGGTVSGLTGTVVLQDNGGNNLSISANGSFVFTNAVSSGGAYAVTVLTQPTSQNCTVTNGSGTASANVTNVAVTCITEVTIGGTVSGLTGTLVLQENGGNNLSISTSGSFVFTNVLASGSAYLVTVLTQPTGQYCAVTNGSGTASANVTNVVVTCGAVPAANAGYGDKRILVAHIMYSDTDPVPFDTSQTVTRTNAVTNFFSNISYGSSTQTYTIMPWAALPEPMAYYQQQDPTGFSAFHAAVAYIGQNYDLSATDIVQIELQPIAEGFPGCFEVRESFQVGSATVTLPVAVDSGYLGAGNGCIQDASIMSHETGHAYGPAAAGGFLHSSMFACTTWPNHVPPTLTDPTFNQTDCGITPGNPAAVFYPYAYYDFMGGYRGHPNVYWKKQAGWITSSQVPVQTQGTVTLDALEVPSSGLKGVQVPLGTDQTGASVAYWAEYRSQTPVDLENPSLAIEGFPDKVKVWINLPNVPGGSVQEGSSLIYSSQVYTYWEFTNGPAITELGVGQTFTDPYRGFSITRGNNPTTGTVPGATVTVSLSQLLLSPAIGATLSSTSSQKIVVTNSGTANVTQSAISLVGRNPSAFEIVSDNCSGTTLAPTQTCTVTVTQSRSTGDTSTYYATLQWTTNDAIRTSPSVGLIGTP